MKFGTDGVRGKAGKELSANLVLRLAMAAGVHFRAHARTNKILVGKDTRKSGYMVENALVSGLTAVGYDVIQIGPMPTPAVAFLTEDLRCDAGIMISASHNPFDDNGIKFFGPDGNKLSEPEERAIEALFADEESLNAAQQTGRAIGSSKRIDDVVGRYIVHIKNSFPRALSLSGMRVVVDAANGAAYKVAPTILRELGAEVIVLSDEPSGYNINEGCGALHPADLAHAVTTYRADVGFALDGDADRLVVVDEKGDTVSGDHLLGALALQLKRHGMLKNNTAIATIMSNGALEAYLNSHGIALLRAQVGDKYVLEQMQQHGANFGGEQSGHIIFADYAKTGDGVVSALQVLALLCQTGQRASHILRGFTPYPQLQEALPITKRPPLSQVTGLDALLDQMSAKGIRHLVRYSGTENKIRVLLEGPDHDALEAHLAQACALLGAQLNG